MLVDAESPSLSHSIHTDDLQPTIASTRINPYSYRFPIHLLLFLCPCILIIRTILQF